MSSQPTNVVDDAVFAVSSRLVSCLVTESLLRAFYVPLRVHGDRATGLLVVLSTTSLSEQSVIKRVLQSRDIFAIVPLRNTPVLSNVEADKHGRSVGLVDPLDMLPEIYELTQNSNSSMNNDLSRTVKETLVPPHWDLRQVELAKIDHPLHLWRKFVKDMVVQDASIEEEILSSFYWQLASFKNPPACPALSSAAIDWEQSLVAGHPTHPMHRARMIPLSLSDYDWYNPIIRFARVPRSRLDIQGPFDVMSFALAQKAAQRAGKMLIVDDTTIVVPIHEVQITNIIAKFQGVDILPPDINIRARGQASIRTLVIPESPRMALKLSVGVKISSSLRTISHFTADFGPRFSSEIVPKLAVDRGILSIEREPASAVYNGVDSEVAKHFTAIFRETYQPAHGECVIVCAALLEVGHKGVPAGVSAVEHVFHLDTYEKRVEFLERYIRLACEALLPPLIYNGVAFEAHAQNVLARFDIESGNLLGFVVRDLGGLRIHPATLAKSTGVDFDFLPGHCVVTSTTEEAYPKFYHTLIHNHLQRLIRLLGMHYNGCGWEILRRHLNSIIPADHELRKVWLDPGSDTVSGKCLMRMRLQGLYRDMVFSPFPNLILYRPSNLETARDVPGQEN
ncbi:IucC family-domain-containing protein [Armillaria nabsnona]|nr:IucC family-domain-containing protein [Armillaria nabsnona]